MSMRKVYKCNICGDNVKELNKLYGLNFTNLWKFDIGGYEVTEDVHICFCCAKQLRTHLMSEPISKELESFEGFAIY